MDTRKVLRKGINSSTFEMYKSQTIELEDYKDGNVMELVRLKRRNTVTMGARLLDESNRQNNLISESKYSLGKLGQGSSNSSLLKEKYNVVQARTKHSIQEEK